MSTLAQFSNSYGPLSSIVNYFSGGGTVTTTSVAASPTNCCKETLSGAVTANTLVTVNNITGRGQLNVLAAYTKDGTARTIRCQVIIDGTTVFDATSASAVGGGLGIVPVGVIDSGNSAQQFGMIRFYQSCVVKIASSLTETDKIATGINYELWT